MEFGWILFDFQRIGQLHRFFFFKVKHTAVVKFMLTLLAQRLSKYLSNSILNVSVSIHLDEIKI